MDTMFPAPTTASAQHLCDAHHCHDQQPADQRRSHERFMVLEVFGRYAGFTAMLPTMAGAANRCVIPEHKFDIERLTEYWSRTERRTPATISLSWFPGAMFQGGEMIFERRRLTPSSQKAGWHETWFSES